MHSKAVIILALAAASTALSIPVHNARGDVDAVPADESDALDLKGLFNAGKDVFTIGKGLVDGFQGIKQLFGGNDNSQQQQQQRRELIELLARDSEVQDESGALDFKSIFNAGKDIFSIGKGIFDGAQGIDQLINGNSQQQQQRRELIELLARQVQDESGALDTSLIHEIIGIGNELIQGAQNVKQLFSDNSQQQQQQQQRREFVELLARQAQDESGAIKFGDIVGIGNDIIQAFTNIFAGSNNNNQRRELFELLARASKREEMELLAREPLFKFDPFDRPFGGHGPVVSTLPMGVAPAPIGLTPQSFTSPAAARSLNELD